jgi:sugar/nucleoside kinase (ribokinase family)
VGFVTSAQLFDVVSLGDVVNDQIIRLPSDVVGRLSDADGEWLKVPLGRKVVLEDDASEAMGGTAANAAVTLSHLGLRVGLAAFLAHDQVGLEILDSLHAHDVDTRLVHVDSPPHTVRNFVLAYAGERTILVRHAGFHYRWTGLRESEVPAWLYVTSLGPDALDYQDGIAGWLDEHPTVRLAFAPGTFQVEAGATRLARLIARADLLVSHRSTAGALLGRPIEDDRELLDAMMALGCRRSVVIDERGGAVAADASARLAVDPFPAGAPRDRTGANDAFSATTVAALVLGLDLTVALSWGAVNYASVAQEFGSQTGLLREADLTRRLDASAPPFAAHEL